MKFQIKPKGLPSNEKHVILWFCIRISFIKTPPNPFPSDSSQDRLPVCPIKKPLTNSVKVKDHLETVDVSDNDIFHVFDCCQCDPYVSQKTWIIICFFSWLDVDDFTCLCTSRSSFSLLSFVLFTEILFL